MPEQFIGGRTMNINVVGRMVKLFCAVAAILCLLGLAGTVLQPVDSHAASAKEIDIKVDAAIKYFEEEVAGGKEFLKDAKGVLVFPSVIKAGFGIGGEYGEGALRIKGKTVDYYSTAAASIGFQIGAQSKKVILVFMQENALKQFRESSGWEAGVDGSVALVELGAGGSLDTSNIKDPIVGFVFGNKGLMYNLTLEGSKFTKLAR
jgi:lipid-binding SYLF domain-containing protein